jgi:hypothetical protein
MVLNANPQRQARPHIALPRPTGRRGIEAFERDNTGTAGGISARGGGLTTGALPKSRRRDRGQAGEDAGQASRFAATHQGIGSKEAKAKAATYASVERTLR